MNKLNVVLDASIKFNPRDIPYEVLQELQWRLTVPNPARSIAERDVV